MLPSDEVYSWIPYLWARGRRTLKAQPSNRHRDLRKLYWSDSVGMLVNDWHLVFLFLSL